MKINRIVCAALMLLASGEMFAGGMFTNTNQSPIFFRQPAQYAVIGVQGAYYDPAGLVFMDNGWHFGIGNQMAIQSREVTSQYAPFAMNVNNLGSGTKKYKGNTVAPVIPNLDLVYAQDKWAASFHLGVVSGGGSCEFDDGLGSFEAPMALLPAAVNTLAPLMGQQAVFSGYDADIHFKGQSMGFGAQLNYAYKIIDNGRHKLSIAAGARFNYIRNAYEGGIFNYRLGMNAMGGALVPADQAIAAVLGGMGLPAATAQGFAQQLGADKEVDCTQTAFAFNPIVNVHYATGAWDFALKYEFITKVELKNSTDINTAGIAQFADGEKSHSDVPALLSGGFNVDVLPQFRIAAGFNIYFDTDADYGGKQEKLGRDSYEGVLGLEYDLGSRWTLSLGAQATTFDFGENNDYLTDMAFSLNSWGLGGGFRFRITDRLALDAAVFNNFYVKGTSKDYADYGNAGATYQAALSQVPGIPAAGLSQLAQPGSDEFYRTSLTLGLGLSWDF